MKAKRFLLGLVLNKRQKGLIWDAIEFSRHTYERRGDAAGQAKIQTVINETELIFDVVKQNYSKEEVSSLLNIISKGAEAIREKFNQGFQKGAEAKAMEQAAKRKQIEDYVESIVAPINARMMEFPNLDIEVCEECSDKDACATYLEIVAILKGEAKKQPKTTMTGASDTIGSDIATGARNPDDDEMPAPNPAYGRKVNPDDIIEK